MRALRILVIAGVVFGSFALAGASGAQQNNNGELPDLPGMDRVRDSVRGQIAERLGPQVARAFDGALEEANRRGLLPDDADLDDLRAAVASPAPLPDPAGEPEARPAASRSRGRSLPATGAPLIGIGLLGIACVSGGRMLLELTRGLRAA